MALRTLTSLIEEVRERADMQDDGNFISDAEITRYINRSIQDLYDLVLATEAAGVYVKNAPILTQTGLFSYQLPSDFYLLKDASLIEGNTVYRFELADSADYATLANDPPPKERGQYLFRFEQDGTKFIYTFPEVDETLFAVTYIPQAIQLVTGTDTFDGYNGWEDYVVVKSAIKCLDKEESDSSMLQFELDTIGREISSSSGYLDTGRPAFVRKISKGYRY